MKSRFAERLSLFAVLAAALAVAILLSACTTSTTIEQTSGAARSDASASDGAGESSSGNNQSGDTQPADPGDEAAPDDEDPGDGTDGEAADDEDPGDGTDPDGDEDPSTPAGQSSVVLLDAGAEPRTELRLMIAPSCGELMTMTQVQDVSQTLGGVPSPGTGPIGNVMEMRNTATPNGENYDVRAEVVSAMAAPDTPPQVAAGIDASLSSIVGLTTVSTVTNRGEQVPGTTRIEGGESLGALRDTVEAVAQQQSPLPVEAVGVGARWETTSVIDVQGHQVVTTAVSEITAMDGTIVELSVTGSQFVEIGSMMDLPGVSAEVLEWSADVDGTTVIDLATISPIRSSIATDAFQSLGVDDPTGYVQLDQTIRSEIDIVSQPDDGCTGRTSRP